MQRNAKTAPTLHCRICGRLSDLLTPTCQSRKNTQQMKAARTIGFDMSIHSRDSILQNSRLVFRLCPWRKRTLPARGHSHFFSRLEVPCEQLLSRLPLPT